MFNCIPPVFDLPYGAGEPVQVVWDDGEGGEDEEGRHDEHQHRGRPHPRVLVYCFILSFVCVCFFSGNAINSFNQESRLHYYLNNVENIKADTNKW